MTVICSQCGSEITGSQCVPCGVRHVAHSLTESVAAVASGVVRLQDAIDTLGALFAPAKKTPKLKGKKYG